MPMSMSYPKSNPPKDVCYIFVIFFHKRKFEVLLWPSGDQGWNLITGSHHCMGLPPTSDNAEGLDLPCYLFLMSWGSTLPCSSS